MHVAIDLGEKHSCLACWESGLEMNDAIININLPGVACFAAQSNPDCWNPANILDYFMHLQQEYLLPSRRPIESAALAVPSILPIAARSEMLGIVEEVLGLVESKILPRPLATMAGYNLHHRSHPLQGDILLVQALEKSLDCSFLTLSETGGIILETQFSTDLGQVQYELASHDCPDKTGCRFDYVLTADNLLSTPAGEEFLAALPGGTQVISEPDLDFMALVGLFGVLFAKNVDPASRLSFIYPYEFYLVTMATDTAPARMQKIPFDTANLELAYDGTYRLTNLATCCPDILPAESTRLSLSIFDLPAGCLPSPEMTPSRIQGVLEIDSLRDDLPPQLIVILDMAAASLHLELDLQNTTSTASSPEALRLRLNSNQDRLLQMLRSQGGNDDLVRDWENHLVSRRPEYPDLASQLQSTLFHLYALNHLWLED